MHADKHAAAIRIAFGKLSNGEPAVVPEGKQPK